MCAHRAPICRASWLNPEPVHTIAACPQILVIAVLMKGVMGRTFNVYQWEALFLLVAGITGAAR